MTGMPSCREFVEALDDHCAGGLGAAARTALVTHLEGCPSCAAFKKTYQASIQLGRAAFRRSSEAASEDVPEALVRAILTACEQP